MKTESLATRIKCSGSAYTMLYDSAGAPFAFPLAPEFTNWRDEQDAWRKTAIFQDMSFHMWNLLIEGRDVTRLLSDLGINSFASFGPMQAKQYVCCNGEGLYVGDAILTCEEENQVYLVGKQNLLNWVRFHLETGKYDPRGSLDDCYMTPFDMGYGFMAKFDHEFCGRKALERVAKGQQHKKVRLVWNSDDTSSIHASMYGAGERFKYMEMPVANYSTFQMDEVLSGGKRVGVSYHPVYSVESRSWISLAVIDESVVQAGRNLTVTWGEAKGGSQKPTVERHVQKPVRVVVETKAVRRD